MYINKPSVTKIEAAYRVNLLHCTICRSSNVLHYRALLQKCPIGVVITTLTRWYHTSIQIVENYTLIQFDETICFSQTDGKCAFEPQALRCLFY